MTVLSERYRIGASLEDISRISGLDLEDLTEWERKEKVPRKHRRLVRWALWGVRRDRALERAGIPSCEWVAEMEESDEDPDVERFLEHAESCDVCRAVDEFVRAEVGEPPPLGGPVLRFLGLLPQEGWPAAAVGGIMMVLLYTGLGILFFLGKAVVDQDPGALQAASGLVVVSIVGGGAGGIGYHLAAPLRRWGRPGYYASGVAAVSAYGGGVALCVVLFAVVTGRTLAEVDPEIAEMFTTPLGWLISGALCVLFGLVLGHTMYGGGKADGEGEATPA